MKRITCYCGRCSINLGVNKVYRTLICACEDCRQALEWAHKKGGEKPNLLPKLVYVDSKIEGFSGFENMGAFQLREGAKSTRVYCKTCFSILAVDHPNYNNERLMFFENHCETTLDTSVKPTAITYLDHLPRGSNQILPDNIPKFRDLDKPDEWEEFATLLEKTAFPSSVKEGIGIRLYDIFKKIGHIEVLNLKAGAPIQK
tara:strand:- start:390 stop:992 length:603 start_codon:yes stop_codon:yes gene_type:complete